MSEKKRVRLDKFLANSHVGTRSDVKVYIKEKRVKVNGVVITDPGFHVKESDIVTLDDQPVTPHHYVYIMLYKPSGLVSTTSDNEPSVLTIIEHPYVNELHIAGRLDKDVEGLLILTNDGDFTHRLISPKKHVEKEYYIYTKSSFIVDEQIERYVESGLVIDGKKTLPAKISQIDEKIISITIIEGKYHQIKKMCKTLGIEWEKIERVRIGGLRLGELKIGEWKELTKEELAKIFQ